MSSETMFLSLMFAALSDLFFYSSPYCSISASHRTPWSMIFRLPIFCMCPICPPSQWYFLFRTVDLSTFRWLPVWLSVIHSSLCWLLNRYCYFCSLVKYMEMSSSGSHGKSVSFSCFFFSMFVNARNCFLRWSSISFSVLCVKFSTFSSISFRQNLLYTSRNFSFHTSLIPR